jgi:hypothetical protein
MYDLSHEKYMVDTLRPVVRKLAKKTAKVQARARRIGTVGSLDWTTILARVRCSPLEMELNKSNSILNQKQDLITDTWTAVGDAGPSNEKNHRASQEALLLWDTSASRNSNALIERKL